MKKLLTLGLAGPRPHSAPKATRSSTRSRSAAPAAGTTSPSTRSRSASTLRTAASWRWWISKAGKVVGQITQLHGVHGIAVAPRPRQGLHHQRAVQQRDHLRPEDAGEDRRAGHRRRIPMPSATSPRRSASSPCNGRSNDATAIDAKNNEIVGSVPGRRRSRRTARWMAPARCTSTSKTPARSSRSTPPSPPSPAAPRSPRAKDPTGLAIDVKNKKLLQRLRQQDDGRDRHRDHESDRHPGDRRRHRWRRLRSRHRQLPSAPTAAMAP